MISKSAAFGALALVSQAAAQASLYGDLVFTSNVFA